MKSVAERRCLMRILIVRNSPTFMDVRYNTYNIQELGLARALVKKGHVCDIVFWTNAEETDVKIPVAEGGQVTVFYRRGKSLLKNAIYPGLDTLVAQYDVVQSSEYNQFQSWLLARKYPQKTVIFHGPYYSSFNKRYNAMCRLADILFLPGYRCWNTPFMTKSHLAARFLIGKGIDPDRITTTGVGMDLDALLPKETGELPDEVKRIGSFSDELKLLYVGRVEPRRNIPFLLEVLSELKQRNISARLILIGTGEKEYCDDCARRVKELGLTQAVYWIPRVEQKYLAYAYRHTDVFLLPTVYEIFGMVLLEAMYFKKPVITTQNGGSEMLIENGKDGIVIPQFEAARWCDAVLKAVGDSCMGPAAGKKIRERFTWDKLVDNFLQVYEKKVGPGC